MTFTNLQNLINSNLADLSNIVPLKHREVETALMYNSTFLYEVRELDIPDSQLATFTGLYFNGTGLGVDLFDGWAICNGQNGTRDRGGRTSIGWKNGDTIGAIGGNKDAVVVSHSHSATTNANITLGSGDAKDISINGIVSPVTGAPVTATVNASGESGIDKNMQPYMVLLKIMKL